MTLGTLNSDGPLCPFTHRVLIAAGELGADVDVAYGRDIPEAVQDTNASGTWPAFVPATGGDMLQDSSEIVDYLIDHSGESGDALSKCR
jgi:glutathione S-transferase